MEPWLLSGLTAARASPGQSALQLDESAVVAGQLCSFAMGSIQCR